MPGARGEIPSQPQMVPTWRCKESSSVAFAFVATLIVPLQKSDEAELQSRSHRLWITGAATLGLQNAADDLNSQLDTANERAQYIAGQDVKGDMLKPSPANKNPVRGCR